MTSPLAFPGQAARSAARTIVCPGRSAARWKSGVADFRIEDRESETSDLRALRCASDPDLRRVISRRGASGAHQKSALPFRRRLCRV